MRSMGLGFSTCGMQGRWWVVGLKFAGRISVDNKVHSLRVLPQHQGIFTVEECV